MHKIFSLGERLQKCADFVRQDARFVDIGTDHGYLPIWLLKSEKIKSAMACDIGEKPLEYAVHNAEKYQVELETRISDGFKNIDENSFDVANIAGMGGELIVKILTDVDFIKNKDKSYILQPMTGAFELRKFLLQNQFKIEKEEILEDSGRVYSVMLVKFTGESEEFSSIKMYMGEIVPNSPYSEEYATKVTNDLKNKALGLKHKGENTEEIESVIEEIKKRYMEN